MEEARIRGYVILSVKTSTKSSCCILNELDAGERFLANVR